MTIQKTKEPESNRSTDNRDLSTFQNDPVAFWREHDRAFSRHRSLGNATLSHDLYRGMPTWFNAYYAYFQKRAILRLLRCCDLSSGIRALDVGCGTGRWSELMVSLGWKPYGIDIGRQALTYAAKANPDIRFICGMLPDLGFADGSFDLAVSVTVIQHIPHLSQLESLQAIFRTLKAGGYLVICETIDTHDPSSHIFGNTYETWVQQFNLAGFQIVSVTGSEYLPQVRFFHWFRSKRKRSHVSTGYPNVESIAELLTSHSFLAMLVWLGIIISYPFEYIASFIFPARSARLVCFLLQKK